MTRAIFLFPFIICPLLVHSAEQVSIRDAGSFCRSRLQKKQIATFEATSGVSLDAAIMSKFSSGTNAMSESMLAGICDGITADDFGSVICTSVPSGASITVDGDPKAFVTDYAIPVLVGKRTVRIASKDSKLNCEKIFQIEKNIKTEFHCPEQKGGK